MMNVKRLKNILENLIDDLPVYLESRNWEYNPIFKVEIMTLYNYKISDLEFIDRVGDLEDGECRKLREFKAVVL